MARRQDGVIVAGMPLRGRDVADAAVAMIDVVPLHEAGCPGARLVEVGKAFGRKLRSVRIPIKPATDSTLKPAACNAPKSATRNALQPATRNVLKPASTGALESATLSS